MIRVWTAALVALTACTKPSDGVDPQPDPAPTPSSSTAPNASAAARVEPPPTPTLDLVPVKRKGLEADAKLYPVEGALLVAQGHRVGRLTKDGVESVAEIPKGHTGFGDNKIDEVTGAYPDALDVLFSTTQGRAPAPTYAALTGEGRTSTFAPGGGMGWISGVARVDGSTLIHGYSMMEGHRIITVRGPDAPRTPTSLKEAGCTAEEVVVPDFMPAPPAIEPYAFGSTRAGTLFALGALCRERGPAAEIWDAKGGKPRIEKLKEWMTDVGFLTLLLRGKGEDQVYIGESGSSIVQYDKGAFTALPKLPRPLVDVFVSPDGTLHANDGETIHRWDGLVWTDAAHLAWSTDFDSIALWEGVFYGTVGGTLYQLDEAPSPAFHDGCKTPFVHLYDVSPLSEPKFTFPTTRKALSTFPDVKDVTLVDFVQGKRRLGAVVPSRAVGDALIAHVKAHMKDESPRLLCFSPAAPREIPLTK